MLKPKLTRKLSKRVLSLVLILSVLLSLAVPYTVNAEDQAPAKGNDIYALAYKINPKNSSVWANIEIVFQKGDTPDPSKEHLKTFSNFADGQFGDKPQWASLYPTGSGNTFAGNAKRFVIKDKIQPTSISGWFRDTWALDDIQGLENLDTSQCTNMSNTFTGMSKLTSLDLSCLDTSKVENFNGCINGSALQSVNISGFKFDSCQTVSTFIKGNSLTSINMSNIDISKPRMIKYFITNCPLLEELDCTSFNPRNVRELQYAFHNNASLKTVTFGTFQPGADYNGDYKEDGSLINNNLYFNNMFSDCTSLEEVDFNTFEIPTEKTRIEYANMFNGCKSLRTIKNIDKLFIPNSSADSWTHRMMFKNCSSLEEIDLSKNEVYIRGAEIFSGCSSLKSLNLGGMGVSSKFTNWDYQNTRTFNSTVDTGQAETNIFEGCDELSEFTFSPYYPPANQQGSDPKRTMGYGNSIPIDRTWIKIAQPADYPSKMKDGKTAMPDLSPLNERKRTEELFCDFQPQYAGTWVAESKITLNANGGTPNQQAIKGARGMTLNYNPDTDITTPTRNGYKFKGWYADRESDQSQQLLPGVTTESWSYYAHWEDNTYTIVLHNNETPEQTETIENVKYAQFVPLSGKIFTSSDSSKILAGWNTRSNGEGMEFAANESVDKLTVEDGGTVDLYAMWQKPDVIISFASHGGTEISPRYYTLKEDENVPYGNLSEPMKDGYTFMGWYTEENGNGKKVVTNETDPNTETAYVSLSTTLHAYWQKKPDVTFNLQGGTIDNESTYVKVCDYDHAIGTIPTPVYGNQAFMGWFTAADGGTEITSATKVTGDVTYYAHWGWQPRFETNGGSYIKYEDSDGTHYANPNYPVQSSSSYNLGTLPVVKRENYTFDGWYSGDTDTKINDNDTVDLSDNSVFKARWSLNPICTVTLDYNDETTPDKTIKVYKSQNADDNNIIGELPTPTREGYRFEGWYDGSNHKYTYQSRLDSNTSDTLTLTARWTKESHTVTFDPTDGEMVGSTTYTVADGKTITYLPGANYIEQSGSATIIKKSFDGWYTEQNGGGTKLTTETQITADTTYYANWVDNRRSSGNYNSMIRWGTLSGNDVTNLGDTLVFHPSASGNISAHLTVDFALENQNNQLPAGSVRITLPKKFFTGWDRSTDVTTTESTFNNFDVTTSADGEYYILTNAKDFKSTVLEPVYTVDPMKVPGGYVDENGVCRDYFNKTFNIKIELKENGANDYTVFQERTLGVELHTDVQTTTYKEQASATLSWSDSWGERPSDADEYFYVVWTLNASNYNSNQPYQLKWSENTVHDGSVVYSNGLNTWSPEYSKDEIHRITVVTKHRRDEAMAQGAWAEVKNEAILNVKWKSGFEQQFRTTGVATAYVGEIIDGNIRTLAKTVNDEYNQEAHYVYGGQDLILNNDANNIAAFIYHLSYTEKTNVDNPTWTQAGEMSVTPRTYVLTDGVKDRDDVIVTAEKPTGSNTRSLWQNANYQDKLDDGDYYFNFLDINVTEYDSVYLNGDWANPYENDNLYDYGDIKVYYRTMGSNDFELLKTVSHDEMILSTESKSVFEKGYEIEIALPADTVGYKVEYTSSRYTTDIKVNTGLKLKNTRKLHSLVSTHTKEGRHTLIKNKSVMNIQRSGKADIIADSTVHNAWLSAYELTLSESELYAAKSCLNETKINNPGNYFVTDAVASTVEFPVAITGWAYSKNQLGYIKRVRSGIFHDLLPHGFMVDRSKIIVCGRTAEQAQQRGSTNINSQKSSANATSYGVKATEFPGQISSDYYSVTFKDNWEGSGQTMMIINVNCPEEMTATGFVVYYKCKTTINNLHINGTTPKNYVAFTDTTPDQSKPENRINTKNYLDTATRPLFDHVDNEQTAYTYSTTTLKTPNVYQYGADSNVSTEGADIAKHQVVGLNTGYSYNISYEGDTSTQTHNLIVYDVIERYIGGSESQWLGEFKGVDISGIKNQYSADEQDGKCAPVVYYATKSKKEFTKEMFNLTRTDIWSTTPPEEMKNVTAIALDCRKTDTGKNFVLGVKKGIEFTINMLSPDDEERSEIETYNEAVVTGFNNEIGKDLVMNTLTSVTLRFTKPQFIKSAFPASGTQDKPESVVNGSVMDYILTVTNPDPELPMTNIVIEDKFPMALSPNNYYTVKFNDGATIPIDNTARVTYSIETVKNDNNEDVRLFTATVDVLNPGDTVEITIPVKVGLEKGTTISNEAKITSINGVPYSNIASNTTYHTVTGVKAKILKVNAKDVPLAGATLEIYERNETNCDEQGNLKSGAVPMTLKNDETTYGTSFTSSTEVSHFDVAAGEYILHESAVPENSGYKLADDIPFIIDVEGIIYVNGEPVNYVKMVDEPAYKVIFHENKPGGNADEIQKVFRIYEPMDLSYGKVEHFYDIPEWAGDEYVFAGWYHNDGYSECDTPDTAAGTASNFESDTFAQRENDYHLYAKWIKVGTVAKSDEDTNIISGYRGFGLAGVQIREPQMYDDNYTEITPGGLRFVTSLSEELLRKIDALSSTKVSTPEGNVDVEYGYAVGTEANINAFIGHYTVADTTAYTLQYKGENVNGKNTMQKDSAADTDYRYITNVNCTKGTRNNNGTIKNDHRNYTDYRLYTLVVTYEGADATRKADKIDARSYIRYYDANGKLRVFYNIYKKNTYYGGCMCSFNQVSSMALPAQPPKEEQNP